METTLDQLTRFVCARNMAREGLLEKLDEMFPGWKTFNVDEEIGEDGLLCFTVDFDEDNDEVKQIKVVHESITCNRRMTEDDVDADDEDESEEIGKWAEIDDMEWEGWDGIGMCEELDEFILPVYYDWGAFPLGRRQLVVAERETILTDIDFYVEGDTEAYREAVTP